METDDRPATELWDTLGQKAIADSTEHPIRSHVQDALEEVALDGYRAVLKTLEEIAEARRALLAHDEHNCQGPCAERTTLYGNFYGALNRQAEALARERERILEALDG